MQAPKSCVMKKKSKRASESMLGGDNIPSVPKQALCSLKQYSYSHDSDSDTAAGFDSNWNN